MKCVICKQNFQGLGNNAYPIAKGRCCDSCNKLVITARIKIVNDEHFKRTKNL